MEQIRLTTKLTVIATIMLFGFVTNASSYYKVVFDPWTTAQVTANAGEQKLIEDKHNERLDTISAKQKKIAQYTATMESIKELYRISMTNIRGFGEDTRFYKEIGQLSVEILTDVPTVTKFLVKHPGKNYILCLNELTDIMAETEGLVSDFVNIVNNGKVKNPLKKAKSNDGYNFLDRYTRVSLAYRIYGRLLDIKYRMDAMVMMCQFGNWGDVFFKIDPQSWATVFQTNYMVDGLINDWNRLSI